MYHDLPQPGGTVDGRTVVASVYQGGRGLSRINNPPLSSSPYFSVVEVADLDIGTVLYDHTHHNIVPAVEEYQDAGGDY